MVDSRQKGARAEAQAKQTLIQHTGLNWQRVPGSGALDEKHGLKGDLYVPNEKNVYCVEVKHYKDDHLTSKILTSKDPQLMKWWSQTVRESKQVDREPLLLFKFDRSKWFACAEYTFEEYEYNDMPRLVYYDDNNFELIIQTLENWLKVKRKFIV
jgi:Holliday junction resolvase